MITSNFNKTFSLIALALTIVLNCSAADNGKFSKVNEAEGMYWSLDTLGTLRIESMTGKCPDFKKSPFLKYRDQIKNIIFVRNNCKDITRIGKNMFKDLIKVEHIYLPSTILFIADAAFEDCTSLVSLTIPERVEYVGENILRGCYCLETLSLPFVGADGFLWTNSEKTTLTWIFGHDCSIPSHLKNISVSAGYVSNDTFNDCSSSTDIHLGDNVMTLPLNAQNNEGYMYSQY